jgi:PhoH-like ATPase
MKTYKKQCRFSSIDEGLVTENVFVVDNSAVINDSDIFFNLGRHRIIVPTAVIKELNGLKRSTVSRKANAAKRASKTLEDLGYRQNMAFGALTSVGSRVKIFNRYMTVNELKGWADNQIVGAALKLKKENRHYNVVLVTNDRDMQNVTISYGIQAENYPFSRN